MKKLTIILMLFTSIFTYAQSPNSEKVEEQVKKVQEQIWKLKNENKSLKIDVKVLNIKLKDNNAKVLQLTDRLNTTNDTLNQTTSKLGLKIKRTESAANSKIRAIDDNLRRNTLYEIIALLLGLILICLIYLILNKKQRTDKTDVIDQLSKTKSSIEESLVKEFGKQTELLETQLQLTEEQAKNQPSKVINQEIDHSLALKVADEITLIERNISLMDKDVKGLKQLSRSVQKLKDNLNANGYEISELLGKQYHQGMKVIVVSSIPDENIEKDLELITKVIKPQVNYKEKMIQTAQIETSKGI